MRATCSAGSWLGGSELRCIEATTLDEFRKHVEKDKALERCFQPVLIEEPTVEATIRILRGIMSAYEVHHGIKITDDAVLAAAQMSARCHQRLPAPRTRPSTIDEAASRLKMEIESLPQPIDILQRRSINGFKIELAAPPASRTRPRGARGQPARVHRQPGGGSPRGSCPRQAEKAAIDEIQVEREKLEQLQHRLEAATRGWAVRRRWPDPVRRDPGQCKRAIEAAQARLSRRPVGRRRHPA
ncbi:MAG: hypothetical protein H6740_09435 [Alphaproteobacteria bacterium]|nr:hypothetical protein [Alphaproteobacteria bacterium]